MAAAQLFAALLLLALLGTATPRVTVSETLPIPLSTFDRGQTPSEISSFVTGREDAERWETCHPGSATYISKALLMGVI